MAADAVHREGLQRLELFLGPRMGAVVVDGEEAQELVAVEQRADRDGVEAFLDDRSADAGAARVVRVVHGEERAAFARGERAQRAGWELPNGLEIRRSTGRG